MWYFTMQLICRWVWIKCESQWGISCFFDVYISVSEAQCDSCIVPPFYWKIKDSEKQCMCCAESCARGIICVMGTYCVVSLYCVIRRWKPFRFTHMKTNVLFAVIEAWQNDCICLLNFELKVSLMTPFVDRKKKIDGIPCFRIWWDVKNVNL